ncbi:hypothetical protein CC86DRAFT_408243 [Ophiobolus disseminans]|uniref:Uncharacterized protein n=1 Tax=Ophiobolus disseminans TaxID=1469910 RepID=A0A6A6ZUX0_9PLEO|nr:hypothetical protein CC86DRAFT_408243 [Ophiobolus disseminans]
MGDDLDHDKFCAAEILRDSMKTAKAWRRVSFIGEVDEDMYTPKPNLRKRPSTPIHTILAPVFDPIVISMNADNWEQQSHLEHDIAHLLSIFALLTIHAPFALHSTYIMFFARLFIGSGEMCPLLRASRIYVTDDWNEKTRTTMFWSYRRDKNAEFRAAHDIQDTALQLRDWLQDVHREAQGDADTVHAYAGYLRRPYVRVGRRRWGVGGMRVEGDGDGDVEGDREENMEEDE